MDREIREWLESLGLGRYADAFADNEIDFQALPHISEDDLKEVGVALGARRKLLAAIAELQDNTASSITAKLTPGADGASPDIKAEAERRQLTVMFCDMAGSTALSTRLDPEDYRKVVRDYHDACASVIKHFGGYVGKFMGDGILAYFGYPRAHEDDARQAISAGLGVIAAVADIAMPDGEPPLAVRIGIATGPVVIGDIIGEGSVQELAVTGETPNLAARLQVLAEPNAIAVAPSTHALAGGLFDYETHGRQTLKGIEGKLEVWRVIGERRVEDRFTAAHRSELTPLIGREEELELLLRRWSRVKGGEGQMVLLAGEPGIGKSRLVRALRDRIADEPHTRLIYQCSPHHTSSALYPVIRQLEHAADIELSDTVDTKLDKLESLLSQAGQPPNGVMPLIASLLSIPAHERYPLPDLTPQQLKDRTFTALVDQLVGLAGQRPVLFVLEDAHWIDPTSLELINQVTRQSTDLPVLTIVTYRPEFDAPWIGLPDVATLNLSRLNARACTAMAQQLAGVALTAEVMAQLVAKTDGVPLFVEELTRSVLDARARLRPDEKRAATDQDTSIVIPATLQEALEARLDRSPQIREVAQVGAAIGREFPYNLLARVASLSPAELDAAVADLLGSGLVFARGIPPEASYTFKHALVQDTAYDSMMRGKRRETHKRIAQALTEIIPGIDKTEPGVLAHHLTEADLIDSALPYWLAAGRYAVTRCAHAEAISYLNRGLALLEALPDGLVRSRTEIDFRSVLGVPIGNSFGVASRELEENYQRIQVLCESVDDAEQRFTALWGLWLNAMMRGEMRRSCDLADQVLAFSERGNNIAHQLEAHHAQWTSRLLIGEPAAALKHCKRGDELYRQKEHHALTHTYGGHDPGVCGANVGAHALWLLGYPVKSKSRVRSSLALARELNHTTTLADAINMAMLIASFDSDLPMLRATAAELRELSTSERLQDYATLAGIAEGWALTEEGKIETGLDLIRRSAPILIDQGDPWTPSLIGLCAVALGRHGAPSEGLHLLDVALPHFHAKQAHWWDAELYRIKGELLANSEDGDEDEESCLRRALKIAGNQKAKSLELRAAVSLARLLRDRGKQALAREALEPVYSWFTEGFDSPDLINAKLVLKELS